MRISLFGEPGYILTIFSVSYNTRICVQMECEEVSCVAFPQIISVCLCVYKAYMHMLIHFSSFVKPSGLKCLLC